MQTIESLYQGMEEVFEDLDHIHKSLVKKLTFYDKSNDEFDENHKNLVATINNNANAMSGVYKNAHLQKQIDVLRKIIVAIPPDVRAKYVTPELLLILGD